MWLFTIDDLFSICFQIIMLPNKFLAPSACSKSMLKTESNLKINYIIKMCLSKTSSKLSVKHIMRKLFHKEIIFIPVSKNTSFIKSSLKSAFHVPTLFNVRTFLFNSRTLFLQLYHLHLHLHTQLHHIYHSQSYLINS